MIGMGDKAGYRFGGVIITSMFSLQYASSCNGNEVTFEAVPNARIGL